MYVHCKQNSTALAGEHSSFVAQLPFSCLNNLKQLTLMTEKEKFQNVNPGNPQINKRQAGKGKG